MQLFAVKSVCEQTFPKQWIIVLIDVCGFSSGITEAFSLCGGVSGH